MYAADVELHSTCDLGRNLGGQYLEPTDCIRPKAVHRLHLIKNRPGV